MQNTRGELPQRAHTYVAADGSADYTTIQAAIDAVPLHNTGSVQIHIRPGVYKERVEISGDKPYITLTGEGERPEDTVITYDVNAGCTEANGDITTTFRTATVEMYANYCKVENLLIVNSYDGCGNGGRQALALYASAEHLLFEHCIFKGCQDTLYAREGSHLYRECYIEGDVDFIFGGARAVFDKCEIHSINVNPQEEPNRGGYIAAPSTPISQRYGFWFTECTLTADNAPNTVFLGRPWHPGSDPQAVGSCVFMHCKLGAHIREDGWKRHMGNFLAKNARLYEFENEGPGAVEHEDRPQLTKEQAAEYTFTRVLGWADMEE